MKTFYIPGNTPSSKNSKMITRSGCVLPSKNVRDWVEKTKGWFGYYKNDFLEAVKGKEKPYRIGFEFIRDSKRKFDYANAVQAIQDMMTGGFKKNRNEDTSWRTWIDDDNADELLPVFLPYKHKHNDGGCNIIIFD